LLLFPTGMEKTESLWLKLANQVTAFSWHEPHREGTYNVVLATPISPKVEDKDAWFHLSHCTHYRPHRVPALVPEAANTAEQADGDGMGCG